jgi:hypothetical protein
MYTSNDITQYEILSHFPNSAKVPKCGEGGVGVEEGEGTLSGTFSHLLGRKIGHLVPLPFNFFTSTGPGLIPPPGGPGIEVKWAVSADTDLIHSIHKTDYM